MEGIDFSVSQPPKRETFCESVSAFLTSSLKWVTNIFSRISRDWGGAYRGTNEDLAQRRIVDMGDFLNDISVQVYLQYLQIEKETFEFAPELINEGNLKALSEAKDENAIKKVAKSLLNALEPSNKPILVPITVSKHITWIVVQNRKVCHFDPKGRALNEKTALTVSAVAGALEELGIADRQKDGKILGNHVRWQNDKHNCGRYGLLFAERIAEGKSFTEAIQDRPTDLSVLKTNLDHRIGEATAHKDGSWDGGGDDDFGVN